MIELFDLAGADANATLWAVWLSEDEALPGPGTRPRAFARRSGPRGPLTLGPRSNCMTDDMGDLAKAAGRWLAVAPLDGAGNMAPPRLVQIVAP